MILGFFLALIIHFADRRLRTAEDVDAIVDLPLLATVPEDATLKDKKLADFESGYSRTAEAYREMAVNLSYMGIDKDSKTVMITSPDAECGKTVTTINAASALVEAGHKVVVAELDLRRPKVADYLGIEQGRGLSSLLNSDMATEDAIITRDDGLSVLPAGNSLPNPTEILSSHRLEVLLDELKKDFDYVVLDTSPVLVAADAVAVAKHVDGTVIVVNAGITSQDQLVKTVSALEKVKAPIFGILLGRAKLRAKKSHYNYQPEPQGSKA